MEVRRQKKKEPRFCWCVIDATRLPGTDCSATLVTSETLDLAPVAALNLGEAK